MERFTAQTEAVCYPLPNAVYLAHIIDSGKSDPFVIFTLDGERVFKSQTKKKTIHPEWNETFAVTVVGVITEYWESLITDYS